MDQSQIYKKIVELKILITILLETLLILKLECNGGQIKRNTKIEFFSSKLLTQLLYHSKQLINLDHHHLLKSKIQSQNLQEHQALLKLLLVAQVKVTLPLPSLLISALETMMKFHLTNHSNSTLLTRLEHLKEHLERQLHSLTENKCQWDSIMLQSKIYNTLYTNQLTSQFQAKMMLYFQMHIKFDLMDQKQFKLLQMVKHFN